MPTLYNYYNHTDSSYTFSIINKSLGTRKTYVKIGDDNTQIYTESSGNLNIKANTLTIGDTSSDSTVITGSLTVGNNHLFVKSIDGIGYTGVNNSDPEKSLDVIGDTRITNGDFTVINSEDEVILAVEKITGDLTTKKFSVNGTTGNTIIDGDLTVNGYFIGRVPLGTVTPILPVFDQTGNSGTKHYVYANIPSSGLINNEGFQLCDGAIIGSGANSQIIGKYVPDLTNEIFLRGSNLATIGIAGGGSATLTITNIPTHTHTISHTHSGTTALGGLHSHSSNATGGQGNLGLVIADGVNTAGAVDSSQGELNLWTLPRALVINDAESHTHTFSTGAASNTNSGDGTGSLNSTPFDVVPKYMNTIYLIRVK